MAITISARFDSVDMADLARTRLRERGVEYADMRIEEKSHNAAGHDDLHMGVMPWSPFINGAGFGDFGGFGAGMMQPAGMYFNWETAGLNSQHVSNDLGTDTGEIPTATSDVRMSLVVRNDQVRLCEAVLTSCHATKLRRG